MKSTCTASPSEIIAYYDSHTLRETIKHFSIGANTLSRICHEKEYYKVRRKKVKPPTAEELQQLVSEKTNGEIAQIYGIPISHVSWWMQSMKVKRNPVVRPNVYAREPDPNEAIRFSQFNRFQVGHEYEYRFLDDNHVDKRAMRTERGVCVQDCNRHVTLWNGMYRRTILKVDLLIRGTRVKAKELN